MTGSREELRERLLERVALGERELLLDTIDRPELARLTMGRPLVERPAASPALQPSVKSATVATGSGPNDAAIGAADFGQLEQFAKGCVRCGLAATRKSVVFADGNPKARLVVVGEAPGADEDEIGLPFVGRAGKLLDLMLASIGHDRSTVYICNVLKCRPPGNRNPEPGEVRLCSPHLRRQLELVAPDAILALGAFAAQTLLGVDTPIGRLRGTVHMADGRRIVATYHPAALLRNNGWVRASWDDLQLLGETLQSPLAT